MLLERELTNFFPIHCKYEASLFPGHSYNYDYFLFKTEVLKLDDNISSFNISSPEMLVVNFQYLWLKQELRSLHCMYVCSTVMIHYSCICKWNLSMNAIKTIALLLVVTSKRSKHSKKLEADSAKEVILQHICTMQCWSGCQNDFMHITIHHTSSNLCYVYEAQELCRFITSWKVII